VFSWLAVRLFTKVDCTPWTNKTEGDYSENEKVFSAMSLSFLVYGCEDSENLNGTVDEILNTQRMGIILENADISRIDAAEPSSAMIDSAAFIGQTVGSFRFLTDLKDSKSSFYGAAFADDANQTVWISYSGSVSFTDAMQSVLLAVGAGLSKQEKYAFKLYENVLKTDEIQNGYDLLLTGHSLGGALAAMVSRMSGTEAITISGADGLALRKINGIVREKPSSYRITNYITSTENSGFSVKDLIQRMMFWGDYDGVECHVYPDNGMVDNTHCVFGFVWFEDGDLSKPYLPEEVANET